MINSIINQAPLFLLIFARTSGLIFTLPLLSTRTVSRIAKIALAGYMSFILIPSADFSSYGFYVTGDGVFSIYYIFLLIGEVMIGVIIGFFVSMIFAAFSTAGQFFAFQMGFSAASAFDSLSQVENPLMGQYFNFIGILVFLQNQWFQKIFIRGLSKSLNSLNAISLVENREGFVKFLLKGLTNLFSDALVISLPIIGTLLLITVCTGLLSKAAPQMNLLSEGFPIMLIVSFIILFFLIPFLCSFFVRVFNTGFSDLINFIESFSKGGKG